VKMRGSRLMSQVAQFMGTYSPPSHPAEIRRAAIQAAQKSNQEAAGT